MAVAGTVGLAVYRQAWRGGAGDDRPAPRGAADGAAARLVYPDLDEETTAWEVYEEGKPKWSRGAVVDPEGSGRVLRCSLTGGVPYSSAHFYRNLPPRPDAGPIRLVLTLSFRFPPTTQNNQNKPPIIQALEFTTSEWRSGRRYELALQWLNVGLSAPCWRYWDARGPDHWRELKIPAPLEGDRWHALRLEGTFREERVVYDRFVIDGRRQELGITAPPAEEPGTPDKLAVGFQLNGNARQDPYHLDLDRVYLAIDRD
jgi:hypothetical protein